MKTQNSLKVSILGRSFSITTDESPEDILLAAELVNSLMKEKLDKNPLSKESNVALVTALQIATDLKKQVREFNEYKKKAEDLKLFLDKTLAT